MNYGPRSWIKVWVDQWLNGTTRFTLSHKERSIWIDLLALAGKSRVPGVICSGMEGDRIIGMPLLRVAGVVDVPAEELTQVLLLFEAQDRVRVEHENGRLIIRILNWDKYQADYSRQKRYKEKKRKEREQVISGATGSRYTQATRDGYTEATGDGYTEATPPEVEVEAEREREREREGEGEGEALAAAFSSIGFEKPFGQKHFQNVFLKCLSERNPDEWLTMVMEATIQECQLKKIVIPPQFYAAKRNVETRENEEARQKFKRTPL